MKTYNITIYNRATGKITDIYDKEFFDHKDAVSYCRGRTSDKENAMCEEKKKIRSSRAKKT